MSERVGANAEKPPKRLSKLEETMALHLRSAGIPFEREVTFHPTRKWRFDFLITGTKIAIECEGGIYSEGRTGHSSITGIERDIEKGNAATLLGYRVFRFTEKLINRGEALRLIEQAISTRQ